MVFTFESDITGVVGPNGCGKSNVVDAIRWAMGEQSAKNLRGSAMEDVIFAGSESYGPLGMAEVILTFENNGDAPAAYQQYAEISIGRRLFRNGESEYFINKTNCRLMDVIDFFLGTGVGTKAYSIVEQGRVGQIVSAKPEDRRLILEEAAGITKYKAKKRAALRKMEATEQNLVRVRDILGELDKRMGSLERQAKKAERYKKQRAEMREIDLWVGSHRYLDLVAQEKRALREEAELGEKYAAAEADLAALEQTVEAQREELAARERAIFDVERQAQEVTNLLKLNESHLEFLGKEAAAISLRREESSAEMTRIEGQLSLLDAEDAELAQAAADGEAQQQSMADDLAHRERTRAAYSEERDRAAARLEAARAQAAELRSRLEAARVARSALERRRVELEARQAKVRAERDELVRQLHTMEGSLASSRDALSETLELKLALEEKRETVLQELSGSRERAVELEAALLALRTELGDKRSRQRSLQEIEERLEGYADGVRAVMKRRAQNGPGSETAVLGLVADVLSAPADLEPAVEAALGDRLQSVIVADHEAALEASDYLKRESLGRSSFLPLTLKKLEHGKMPDADRDGVLGHLRDLVTCDGAYAPIADYLLGDTTVVESLEKGLQIWRENGHRSRLVTKSGEVLDPWGAVTGGSRQGAGWGHLQKKREIKELGVEIADLTRAYGETEADLGAVKQRIVSLQAQLDLVRQDAHSKELTIAQGQKDVDRAEADLKRISARLEVLAHDEREMEEAGVLLASETSQAALRAEEDTALLADVEARLPELADAALAARELVEGVQAEVTELKVRVASLGEKVDSLRRGRERNARARLEAAERQEKLRAGLDAGVVEMEKLAAKSEEARAEMSRLGVESAALSERIAEMRAAFDVERGGLLEREAGLKGMRDAALALREAMHEARQRGAESGLGVNHLLQQILDKHGEDLRHHLLDYHGREIPEERVLKRLAELRQSLERIGDVNLTAIEEFEEVRTRHGFLSAQEQDLAQSLEDLRKAIAKINRTSRERFSETFAKVNEKFQEIFPRLFRGGRAHLELTDSEDLLEAGVEIVAQPPGKKLQQVTLLSGGEKALTAVALIFSIFLVKPSPFCMLDEVDAPLDDANIGQFNEIVKHMSKHSQFILITHNSRTMEIAERLYGVTMEEPGVSKLVSVDMKRETAVAA
jgi:chromosome segregation protein